MREPSGLGSQADSSLEAQPEAFDGRKLKTPNLPTDPELGSPVIGGKMATQCILN